MKIYNYRSYFLEDNSAYYTWNMLWEVAFLYVKFDSSEIDAQFECFFTDIKSKKLLFDDKEMMVK
ncbi:conserved hypothetical protein [Staphylococcus aureus]|uniref:Uncharacterized protein n=1 Tax=Staphylococcus aureus TaxID=1280 RepID=A0A0U1MES3_STAAU|nr:predicted protein [Staphylococcus aureus A9635]CRI07681.1 conserved hypothetical protein [Staphylococcus aureus]